MAKIPIIWVGTRADLNPHPVIQDRPWVHQNGRRSTVEFHRSRDGAPVWLENNITAPRSMWSRFAEIARDLGVAERWDFGSKPKPEPATPAPRRAAKPKGIRIKFLMG